MADATRLPEDRTILISVDPYTRDFRYTNQADNSDASTLRVINGDRLIWALDPSITPRTFRSISDWSIRLVWVSRSASEASTAWPHPMSVSR